MLWWEDDRFHLQQVLQAIRIQHWHDKISVYKNLNPSIDVVVGGGGGGGGGGDDDNDDDDDDDDRGGQGGRRGGGLFISMFCS
jgi:hypothetical protein